MQKEKRDFDRDAGTWDEKPQRVKLAKDIFRSIDAAVGIRRGMDAMDFGCGTGLLSLLVLERTGGVACADSSAGMLDVLASKVRAAGLSGVTTIHLTSDDGDGLTGSYDLVTSAMTFHHVRDVPSLVKRLAGLLNRGGILCVADLDPDNGGFHDDNTGVFHCGFARDEMMGHFKDAGLINVASSDAAVVEKKNESGEAVSFTVFLVTGARP
ncbi:MAG: class I SAM-dependent methyltransferase [Spirochaetes bacterium]|nr:class I SAM-dependent methyltransferase [Spirochaetota bacterium]